MLSVTKRKLPVAALLGTYHARGDYTDCYETEIDRAVSLAAYLCAFYTTPLFRVERAILARAVSRPSTDQEVWELAHGKATSFAAWDVEAREDDQVLLCDLRGQTRSWFMSESTPSGTRLLFGSAVVSTAQARGGRLRMALAYAAFLPFHRLYSRALLSSARRKLACSAES